HVSSREARNDVPLAGRGSRRPARVSGIQHFAGRSGVFRRGSGTYHQRGREVWNPAADYHSRRGRHAGECGPRRSTGSRLEVERGNQTQGIATFPPGYTAGKKCPFLVLPHGGPEDNDRLNFDVVVRLIAAMGYVVLEPEYRGS